MKKQCIIVHGCPGDEEKAMRKGERTYDRHWLPWTAQTLEEKGYKVLRPLMPKPWAPNYEAFKKTFEASQTITEDTILIGHSCGCAFLVHWLGETKQKVKKLILVAPWKVAYRPDKSDVDYYGFTINSTVQKQAEEIIIFTANDEEEDGKTSVQLYHKAIGGKIIELKDHGHYTYKDMGTEEFPELIQEITK